MIYLDMDGVCVDVLPAVFAYNKVDASQYPKGEWYLENIEWPDNTQWWRTLPETPWFRDLHTVLQQMDEVYFLSSPKVSPHAASGKILWLEDRFGKDFRNFILTSHKHLLAGDKAVLFDDREKYCDDFRRAGGKAIVVPALGNKIPNPEDMVYYLLEEYERVCD